MDAGTALVLVALALVAVLIIIAVAKWRNTRPPSQPPPPPPPPLVPQQMQRKAVVKEVVQSNFVTTPVSAATRGKSSGKAKVVAVSRQTDGMCMVCGNAGCTKHR